MVLIHRNVLLDLDGTLTDSRPGIAACIKYALEKQGRPVPGDDELLRFVGPPLRTSFAQVFECAVDAPAVITAIEDYRERFAATGMFENSVYDRIPETLDALIAGGARLYLATSKPRVYAQRIVEHFGLAARFRGIFGAELDGSLSEKPELIAHVLRSAGLEPRLTAMVGDRHHDIAGALSNDVFPAGALWGYGSRQELHEAGASMLLADPGEMLAVLSATR